MNYRNIIHKQGIYRINTKPIIQKETTVNENLIEDYKNIAKRYETLNKVFNQMESSSNSKVVLTKEEIYILTKENLNVAINNNYIFFII